jgi:hypothetical protein
MSNEVFSKNLVLSLLPVLAIGMVLSNPLFTVIDDESSIINGAAKPIHETVQLFLSGSGEFEHPPLYDVLLHGWLCLTNGNANLLRLPAIIFYVSGAWILAKAAKRLEGIRSEACVLWIVVLWPYGFHFGRVAAWYSFCFLLVSLATLCYLNFLHESTRLNWFWLFLTCLALVYSNYFGWAFLACLGLDFILRRRNDLAAWWLPFLCTAVLLSICYIPLFSTFLGVTRTDLSADLHPLSVAANGIYNLYCLFVSESVAPWHWIAAAVVGLSISVCMLLTLIGSPRSVRRFFLYFAALFFVMTVLGIINTKRVMLLSPWLILPIGVALGTVPRPFVRRGIGASIILIAGIGWFGILSRNLYAAPRWIEPWIKVAQAASDVIRQRGIVIANNRSFFFYMTYSLPAGRRSSHNFAGLLPHVHRAGVYDPTQWMDAGHPVGPTTLLIKGIPSGETDVAERWLDHYCILHSSERLVRDPGSKWKQRFSPESGQIEWRIEIRSYSCGS